jgi:hypothetical protein
VRIIDVPGGLFIDTHHKGNSVSEASEFCTVLFKRLDRETFYLLAKEMNARLWQVMRQTLAGWLNEGKERNGNVSRIGTVDPRRNNGGCRCNLDAVHSAEYVTVPTGQMSLETAYAVVDLYEGIKTSTPPTR